MAKGNGKTKTERLDLRLTLADYKLTQKVADAWQLSVSEVVRRLVRAEAKRLEGLDHRDPAKP